MKRFLLFLRSLLSLLPVAGQAGWRLTWTAPDTVSARRTLGRPTARDVFAAMPDSLMPLLSAKARRDMLDFLDHRIAPKALNRFGEYTVIDTLTDEYLRLSLGGRSTMQLRLLDTVDSTTVFCLIHSVGRSLRDSRVAFYDEAFHRLNWLELPRPASARFFPDDVSAGLDPTEERTLGFICRALDVVHCIEVSAAPSDPLFTLTLSLRPLSEEERPLAMRLLRTVGYRWTGSGFEPFDP